ncbi:MAG: hypothetical protein LBN21_04060 [Treponema sp.]|jgi:hypothetical protein|nr:hypothetical protein [Treponema sp.]
MKKRYVVFVLLLSALLAACPQPTEPGRPTELGRTDPGPGPVDNTKKINLAIGGTNYPITWKEGNDLTKLAADILWKADYQKNNIPAVGVTGDDAALKDTGATVSVGFKSGSAAISQRDKDALQAKLDAALPSGVTVVLTPTPGSEYPVEIKLAFDGKQVTLTGNGNNAAFNWLTSYYDKTAGLSAAISDYDKTTIGDALTVTFQAASETKLRNADKDNVIDGISTSTGIAAAYSKGNNIEEIGDTAYDYVPPKVKIGGVELDVALSGNNITLDMPAANVNAIMASLGPNSSVTVENISLAGKTVDIKIPGAANDTISLASVHHLRQAFKGAGANMGAYSLATARTPEYKQEDWFKLSGIYYGNKSVPGQYPYPDVIDLFSKYSNGDVIMDGVKIIKTGDKSAIQYSKKLKLADSNLEYYTDAIMVIYDTTGALKVEPHFVQGFGIVKDKSSGTAELSLAPDAAIVGNVASYEKYFRDLNEAGLNYAGGPIHKVVFTAVGDNPNANSNGLVDFIRNYKESNGSIDPSNPKIAQITHVVSGLTFDGSTYLNNGAVANSGSRRDADGKAATGYKGEISVFETNYLKDVAKVPEFKEANIVGNGRDFTLGGLPGYDEDVILNLTNSTLKGDMYDKTGKSIVSGPGLTITGSFKGVVSIEEVAPYYIANLSYGAYLVLHNVSNPSGFGNFAVVESQILPTQYGNFGTRANTLSHSAPDLVLYQAKDNYNVAGRKFEPDFKAFPDGAGGYKITGGTDANFGIFKSNTAYPYGVAPLDEQTWIDNANLSYTEMKTTKYTPWNSAGVSGKYEVFPDGEKATKWNDSPISALP